ncbi:TetR/AcrR family transcriptional regulator [Rhodococcus spongiicola]|uniref:TetR/AcrR family transcriptional regulator n=1 Tax=Rhodococcus spongiicola TaxID=2487352 RepID=A0A438B670_9NOCA|nr:TetR/AcrR family transcriptional regulator [Rhodococcus spongiicola]RVW06451.1 TetR/AcrR family transcriptional regulator [Rhodococcus spongiicola]
MARQQERARRTRAAIVEAAAVEFGVRGYAAASVNAILEGSHATKGAMYFHFESKEELGRAVLAAALEKYHQMTARWMARADLDPFQILHGLIDNVARMFLSDPIVRAEFRLIIEPEFYADVQSGGARVWGGSARELLQRADREGLVREGVDVEKFTRVLAASLAGQRYLSDLTAQQVDLRARFEESLEVVLAGMASDSWLEKWRRQGWPVELDAAVPG